MFPNLCAELARSKFSIKKLSELSGIKYDSRKEMYSIKASVFPTLPIDYLFVTDDDQFLADYDGIRAVYAGHL